uniref:Uncharacterized protein n=1 Tax=Globisporangium ultimum (strain ATCC 200006 / CBS 805.95 / DAOM BR144) TaxID=431595 RepID=K3WR19_GLOUD
MYVAAIYFLPNRKYITIMKFVHSVEKVQHIVAMSSLLCAVELVILTLSLITINTTLSVSGIRQLAFVLSPQRRLLQVKPVIIAAIVFSLPLAHGGNDFTFRLQATNCEQH